MQTSRRELITGLAAATVLVPPGAAAGVERIVRFQRGGRTAYGLLEGDSIQPLAGTLFDYKPSGARVKLAEAKLLCPCEPSKMLAVGLNYKSHLGNRTPPRNPELFYKPITCAVAPESEIVIPAESKNTHYEGELVVVIGKRVKNASVAQAREAIFGVTAGNDVSERDWQNGPEKDLQWWRAKGADTFGPFGPAIARGVDYGKLLLQTRLNGKVVQKQSTADLLFDCPAIVSFVSRYVTLVPGDVIFTGTPGSTQKLSHGDVVEIDIESVGVLRNKVVQAAKS
jgi:2-keto-4-pentenoate hydratase/2-oxohepta-3-ene-1,7-dioic acid hydratase in catechol pathway